MKKVLLISKEWSPLNKTGLGFSAYNHEKIIKKLGCKVITVGFKKHNKDEYLEIDSFFHFLLNYKKNLKRVEDILNKHKPEIIFVESLQTLISEIFLLRAFKKNIKTVIISHGISIYPYKYSTKYLIRFLLWSPYLFLLKKIIKKNNVFMSLDVNSKSNRNLDTKLAKLYNKEIVTYNNFSRYEKINFEEDLENKEEKILLCIGYVNHIKNQIDLIEVAKKLKDTKIKIKIIYNFYNKNYLNKLLKKIKKNNLSNISLFSDKDIDIKKEINNCWSLINTSITEVSPLSLIEGNSLNKIFFSYNVGNLDKFSGNLTNNNLDQMIFNIKSVDKNLFFEKKLKKLSRNNYLSSFNKKNCEKSFSKVIDNIK